MLLQTEEEFLEFPRISFKWEKKSLSEISPQPDGVEGIMIACFAKPSIMGTVVAISPAKRKRLRSDPLILCLGSE